jgi:hypothetical protein
MMIWLEYGGTVNSETVYCCGVTAGARRRETLAVEGITIPLIEDAMFRSFDARIRPYAAASFRASLIGRFFAGERQQSAAGEFWGGYGHIGCCSLLVIQQVLAIDATVRPPREIRNMVTAARD